MQNKVLSLIFGGYNANATVTETTKEVSSPVGQITRPQGGFEVAGFCLNGSYRILSRKTGQIVELSPKQLDEATLYAHIGMSYCIKNFSAADPKTGMRTFQVDVLANKIRQECDEFGPANPEVVRGPGFYLDGGELVVNYGNAVYNHDGQPVDTVPTPNRVYVSGPSIGFELETPFATVSDVHLLESTFESFRFEQSWGAAASIGWFASSVMGAVLPNSPSIILTAAKGSGKTAWATLQSALMGPQAVLRDGVPTVPQVLHAIRDTSVTLICDEFEPLKRTKSQIDNLAELFNSGFTKSPGKGKFTRASGGVLRYFNPPAGVAMCGINLPELDDALESRSVRLSMVPLNRAGKPKSPLLNVNGGQQLATQVGARLRRLLVNRCGVLMETRHLVHDMLQDLGHSARFADTYSPIVAGYIALKNEAVPARQVLEELLRQWGLHDVKSDEQESPSDACLNALLDRKVVLHLNTGTKVTKTHARVRDAIRLVASESDREARRPIETQLEMLGVRPMHDSETDTWSLAVASSQHNIGVRQLFLGTAWARGGWKDALLRVPGSTKGQVRLAGDSVKVVLVKLPESVANPVFDDATGGNVGSAMTAPGDSQVRGEWVN